VTDGALTIQEAAQTTGWSARMLRYVEETGLVVPKRSESGYRLYGPAELQRLRTLRQLLEGFALELSDVGFAARLQRDRELADAVSAWLVAPAVRPVLVADSDWLAYEQDKHLQLLAAASAPVCSSGPEPGSPGVTGHLRPAATHHDPAVFARHRRAPHRQPEESPQ
jgi:MerR family copper efflux transcriptional regulator